MRFSFESSSVEKNDAIHLYRAHFLMRVEVPDSQEHEVRSSRISHTAAAATEAVGVALLNKHSFVWLTGVPRFSAFEANFMALPVNSLTSCVLGYCCALNCVFKKDMLNY